MENIVVWTQFSPSLQMRQHLSAQKRIRLLINSYSGSQVLPDLLEPLATCLFFSTQNLSNFIQ